MRTFSPARLLPAAGAAGMLALAPLGVASIGPAAIAAARASVPHAARWHVSLKVAGPGSPGFTAVTATSGTSAWAFETQSGKVPAAYRFNGSSWARHTLPASKDDFITSASSSSVSNVWAFTFEGQVLRYNGHSWGKVRKFGKPINAGLTVGPGNAWVFGPPGTWHFNGHRWKHLTSVKGLEGASALSAGSIWAYGSTSVAHWNGSSWKKTSVAKLLPKNTQLSRSFVAGIYAASAHSVYAIASGGRQDEGGPLVLLHYNGSAWSRVATNTKLGGPAGVAADGQGGLWIPVVTGVPGSASMEHFSGGKLTGAALPVSPPHLFLSGAGAAKHSVAALAVGFTRTSFNATTSTAVILRFG